jgi:hypothetical protein
VSKLPVISGADCVKALGKIGFEIYRQRGSHIVIVQVAGLPNHHSKSQGTRSRHPPRDHSPNRPHGGRIHHVALRTAFGVWLIIKASAIAHDSLFSVLQGL